MSSDRDGIGRRDFLRGASGLYAALAAAPMMGAASDREVVADESDLTALSAGSLSQAIQKQKASSREVMEAYLARIQRLNPTYNALVSLRDPDELLAEADQADREMAAGQIRGWMHGMPHAIKDLANAKGLPTSLGSPLFAGQIAKQDDLFVSRIRDAGAIFIGKTNTPEFGYGSQTYNTVFGTTRNAYDPNLCAGGSSGGAAVGLATHMLPVADGSDMMGSLRNPAGFNNVIGFRPTQGRVPEVPRGDVFLEQLAVSGPMGRNVQDTIRLLTTLSGSDPRDPLSLRDTLPSVEQFKPASLQGFRIGWMGDFGGYLATEPGVLEICQQSLESLETHGVIVEECQPDYDMSRLWQTWLTFRHWGTSGAADLYANEELRAMVKPEVIWEIEGSFGLTAAQISQAAAARSDWYRALLTLFGQYDLLALPTAQVFPFNAEVHWPPAINGKEMDTYHRWMEVVIGGTLAGVPVVNLPAGFNPGGQPMGLQFLGPFGADQSVLEFALGYEQVTDHLSRRPPNPTA